jgi:hypothetical protein
MLGHFSNADNTSFPSTYLLCAWAYCFPAELAVSTPWLGVLLLVLLL